MNANDHMGGMGEPEYDVRTSIICQRKYCEQHNYPHFAPSDGVCYRCHNNIYLPRTTRNPVTGKDTYTGIATFQAGCQLITSCPHCNYSFCE